MPNNTFIKLFHFLNADADGKDPTDKKDDALGENNPGYLDSGIDVPGPRGNKQDELQSI